MIVLEVDEPHPDDQKEKGSLGEILDRHFVKAGKAHDPPLGVQVDMRYIVEEKGGKIPSVEEFEGIKGVLITGSTYDAYGDNEWILKLMDTIKRESQITSEVTMLIVIELWKTYPDMHFSGVCFGHQILCRTLGAEVGPAPSGDWELGHTKLNLHDIGKKLFRTQDDEIHLHQMHQDTVFTCPSSDTSDLINPSQKVLIWGHSPHTKIQGVYLLNRLFTTQAHLAFDSSMVKREIQMRVEAGSIKEDKDLKLADEASETSHLEHDGDVVAGAILRFFHFEDDGLEA
jgi:GMP synthase-like glutamine amidotransferase